MCLCSLVRDRCSLTGTFRCRGLRCLPVAGEPTPGLSPREAPCSSSIILDLGHEGLGLLSSIHSHKTSLLSFTASLTANCTSRRPNCTGTFQCHSNNEHAISRDRSSDKLGRGSRSSGCLAVVVVLLFAHLGRWWCEEAPDGGGDFLCFGRELPPRARPDRRPDLRGGFCCAAGLWSLRFHFGDFASCTWRVLSGIRKKTGFGGDSACGFF